MVEPFKSAFQDIEKEIQKLQIRLADFNRNFAEQSKALAKAQADIAKLYKFMDTFLR